MKNLIVFYSRSGNNEKLANELKNRMGYELFEIREKRKRKSISILLDIMFNRNSKLSHYSIDLKKYANVIIVSPVWNGKVSTPMRAFLEKEKDNLENYCYIAVCDGIDGQKDRLSDELLSITSRRPYNVEQLSINSLLPEEQRNRVKYTFNYRINTHDLQRFGDLIDSFVNTLDN